MEWQDKYASDDIKPPSLRVPFSAQSDLTRQERDRKTDAPSIVGDGHDAAFSALLPAAYCTITYDIRRPEDAIDTYLQTDLDVCRLNHVHSKLWLAGRPMNARPLHRQRMIGRTIVITEQTDLHLTWSDSVIFVKAFPAYLGSHAFWTTHLRYDSSKEMHRNARGLLMSYTWLICYESDFNIAMELKLLPAGVSWERWRVFAQEVRRSIDARSSAHVNPRYFYGELRLGRLQWIQRLFGPPGRSWIRGYLWGYRTYRTLFERNFAWILIIFLYGTVILTAMQVGLATVRLQSSDAFQNASYGFAVFSMVLTLIVIGITGVVFVVLVVYNFLTTVFLLKKPRNRHVVDVDFPCDKLATP